MKRLKMIHLLSMLVFGASCGGNHNDTSTQNPSKPEVATRPAVSSCNLLQEVNCQEYESGHFYSKTQIEDGAANFVNHFFLQNDTLKNVVYKVNVDNLKSLLGLLQPGQYNRSTHLSGIRFTYGLSPTNEIVLMLQPVSLEPKGGDTAHVVGSDHCYYTDSSGHWIPSSVNACDLMAAEYAKKIMILHSNETKPSKFDPLYDTRSCIMTAQEIMQAYYDNGGSASTSSSDSIMFLPVADTLKTNSTGDYKLHIVALYNVDYKFLPPSFKGYAADFAELCPTNCSTIRLKLAHH